MAFACSHKRLHGAQFCATECPAQAPCGVFDYVRVEKPEDLPPADALCVDVAILDMNHGWPNLGHDSLVHAVLEASCDLVELTARSGLQVRAISFDVRRSGQLPEPPGGRFAVYVGTGGPGHLDPARNDGVADCAQGIRENPAWEPRAFALFDAILADERAALIAVCHTFGVMCRWSGLARPTLRGPEKGGKSTGILENLFSEQAARHPWFRLFTEQLASDRRTRIVDNRLFDLIPANGFGPRQVPIGWETRGVGGPRGDALTMLEFARDAGGVMPRVFGVNHHPEIVDRGRQAMLLEQKVARGDVEQAWADERREILTRTYPDENSDQRLQFTSDATLLGPLRFHIHRQVRLRAESLGIDPGALHEDAVIEAARPAAVPA